ncbi:unnamed protein product, partial [Rotaria magnacalcarata]
KEKNASKAILCPEKPSIINARLASNNEPEEYNLMDLLNSNSKYSVEQILDENDYNFSEVGESAFFSSSESDSDCIYTNESDDDNQSASCSQMDSDLHPFAYVSTASAMQEFLELIRRSQISKSNRNIYYLLLNLFYRRQTKCD